MSRKGGALSHSQVLCIVNRAAVRAGLSKDISPHWLRHAHASHATRRQQVSISLVKETLGRASVSTTKRYLHARPEDSCAKYLPV